MAVRIFVVLDIRASFRLIYFFRRLVVVLHNGVGMFVHHCHCLLLLDTFMCMKDLVVVLVLWIWARGGLSQRNLKLDGTICFYREVRVCRISYCFLCELSSTYFWREDGLALAQRLFPPFQYGLVCMHAFVVLFCWRNPHIGRRSQRYLCLWNVK